MLETIFKIIKSKRQPDLPNPIATSHSLVPCPTSLKYLQGWMIIQKLGFQRHILDRVDPYVLQLFYVSNLKEKIFTLSEHTIPIFTLVISERKRSHAYESSFLILLSFQNFFFFAKFLQASNACLTFYFQCHIIYSLKAVILRSDQNHNNSFWKSAVQRLLV